MSATAELVARIHGRLLDDPDDDLAAAAERHTRALAPLLTASEREAVVHAALAQAHGLGPLEPLLDDPAVTEVLVNAGTSVWVERHGRLERQPDLPEGLAAGLIERVIGPLGLRIDRTSPIVDARLADGSRVHAAIPPVAIDGPCLAIRRFASGGVSLDAFASAPVVDLLVSLVLARLNLVVSGATSSGKTTFLNALLAHVPAGERIITIEDAAELQAADASRGSTRGAAPVGRGGGRDHGPNPGPCRTAATARSAGRRRGPRSRSARHGHGLEHGP